MSVLKKTYRLLTLATGAILLSALSACNMVVEGEGEELQEPVANYINLTLFVSSGEASTDTRSPLGGEDGDSREAGYMRENKVSGITIILYKGSGLNDATAKVDFVQYFEVTEANLEGRDPQGTTYNYEASSSYMSEARYTTGDQLISNDALDFNATYHVLLVANQDVSSVCPKGTPISSILDIPFNNIYSVADADKAKPDQYQQFVMTSERDATIDFSSMSPVKKTSGTPGVVYRVLQPLLIERMSARIDYYTSGSEYDSSKGGYKYNVGTGGDVFVITKVTPFNLYNQEEYLFKRVQDAWPATTTTYLGDETLTNYVVDPYTSGKDNSHTFAYLSPIAENISTDYTLSMDNVSANQKFQINGKDNIIIAYPKENTLMPTSHLKKYATGIAFEGNYYAGGSGTPEKRVYYHYLRHQGELATGSYHAKQWAELSDTDTGSSSVPMNYGIVRNNIYRVDIAGVTEDGIELHIKVKKWDKFTHEVIYM